MTAWNVRQLAGRVGWNLADQIVSSGTNLLLSVLVARSLSLDGFGAFSVAFTIYSFLIGAGRSLIGQPLVVRYASRDDESFRSAARSATGAAALLGISSGIVCAFVGLLLGGPVGTSLLAIGVMLPGLLLQDMWRAVFVAAARPAAAFVNDVVWGVVQFAVVALILWADRSSAPAMILGWGLAALVAALVGGLQFGRHPRIRGALHWLGEQRDLLGYYAAGFLSVMGANQVTLLLIAAIGSTADVGALRAAQVVLGPLNLVGYSVSAFAIAEIARRQMGGRTAIRFALVISAIMVVADLVWGLTLLFLPESVGVALLGDSWSGAQEVLPESLLGLVAIGAGLGASTLMVARGFAKEVFWTSALLAPGFLVFGLLGLEAWGASGAALGLSLAQVVVAPVVWWRVLVLMRRERDRGPDDVPEGDVGAVLDGDGVATEAHRP